jgi:para-nitrobenzyl esterase
MALRWNFGLRRWSIGLLFLLLGTQFGFAGSGFGAIPAPSQKPAVAAPVVKTDSGRLRGEISGPGAVFKGIPFARPPIGNLRWKPPQPIVPWRGVRDAPRPGSPCIQNPDGLTPFIAPMAKAYGSAYQAEPVRSSEDCLYLNVWTPVWPAQHALPVMVWLHGGSNTAGSGSQTTYDGTSLSRRGVVVVTINYRLGILGFFSHPGLTAESSHHSSGNYGLLDQLAALDWVRRNIAQFGGDPGNVTLFGESAGAIDAGVLMTSPLSAGLFRRVISESGPAFGGGVPLAQAEAYGSALAGAAPGNPRLTPLERLRALPAQQVTKLAASLSSKLKAPDGPTVDGWVLTQTPQAAFLAGDLQKVDLLIGLNGRELSAFRIEAAAAAKTPGSQPSDGSGDIAKKFSAGAHPYFGIWTNVALAYYVAEILMHHAAGLDQTANDIVVACPIAAMASLTTAAGHHVFVYRFERSVPGKGEADLGAFHSLEVPFVFGTLQDPTWQWLPFQAADRSLSASIESYWTNFARTGTPNAAGLPNWPAWSDDKEEFLEVDKDGNIASRKSFTPALSSISAKNLKERFKDK